MEVLLAYNYVELENAHVFDHCFSKVAAAFF
jgi:hypothetical protein